MYDNAQRVINIAHDVWYNYIWDIIGRRMTERSPSSITRLKLDFQKWTPAKCNDEN